MHHPISRFSGAYRWLSNFWLVPILYQGTEFVSTENAYQAAKAPHTEHFRFVGISPGQAKHLGKRYQKPEWQAQKHSVMQNLLQIKFAKGTKLADWLLQTGDRELIEGNPWGDTYWGVCNGVGENQLGKLLMEQRTFLKDPQ